MPLDLILLSVLGALLFIFAAWVIVFIRQICRDLRMVSAYLFDIEQIRRERLENRRIKLKA